MKLKRLLPLSGFVFVATVVLMVVFTGDTPVSTAPGDEVAAFYADHEAEQFAAAFVLAASALFLVLFSAALSAAVPASPVWERVLHAGTTLAAAIVLITATVHFALVDADVAPAALEALNAIDGNFWVGFNAALGVMMLGAAGLLIPHAGASRGFGWAALVLGVALFIPFADFVGLLLTGVWIAVMSVRLAFAEPAASTSVPAPAG